MSTCRCELKKLAQILVRLDPDLFPSPKNINESFKEQTAPEIRTIAAKSLGSARSNPLHDPDHIRASVADRLTEFTFLNNPPTATVSPQLLRAVIQSDGFAGGSPRQLHLQKALSELL